MASSDLHRLRLTGVVALLLVLIAGCGRGKHQGDGAAGLFNNQQQATISCLVHQRNTPGPLYTGGQSADTGHILQMMQYYTSNGDKLYCDGAAANAVDRSWAQLYVSLGGTATKVRAILNP